LKKKTQESWKKKESNFGKTKGKGGKLEKIMKKCKKKKRKKEEDCTLGKKLQCKIFNQLNI